jgi:hypothetical protein
MSAYMSMYGYVRVCMIMFMRRVIRISSSAPMPPKVFATFAPTSVSSGSMAVMLHIFVNSSEDVHCSSVGGSRYYDGGVSGYNWGFCGYSCD